MLIKRVGITAALCVFGSAITPEISGAVYRLAAAVRRREIAGVVDLVPSYTSLMVRFDPLITDFDAVSARIKEAEQDEDPASGENGAVIEIPVCYGGEYGPDLADVAEHTGLSPEEVIRLHSERIYPIYMLGFLPGFPYLGGLDPKLFTPRLSSPRKAIPAGSVGIGGQQTGIYPMESPGGWQLIGRTPMKLFDPSMPLPYHAGDSIRFIPVSEEEYRQEAERWRSK